MKVLITGFTALQINTEKRTIQKIDVPASIVKALREAGHEVDWRKVTPGEDLSSYDVAWVNLAPLNSLNGRQGAMGVIRARGGGHTPVRPGVESVSPNDQGGRREGCPLPVRQERRRRDR